MAPKQRSILLFVLLVVLICKIPAQSFAEQRQSLTLAAALEQVFSANPDLAMFLREQDLVQEREKLSNYPTIKFNSTPGEISNGELLNPKANLTATLQVFKGLDLNARLDLGLNQSSFAVTPAGSVDLNYKLIGTARVVEHQISAEASLRQYENSLVLKTVDLLIELREKLDEEISGQAKLAFLEDYWQASLLVADYDDLKLKKDLREQKDKNLEVQEQITQLQLELALFLGGPENSSYDPNLQVQVLDLSWNEEDYLEKFAETSQSLQGAYAKYQTAQNKLEYEQKTAGWRVDTSGSLSLDQSWNIQVTASKDLYPRKIVVAELELEAERAKQEVAAAEKNLLNQLKSTLQAIWAAEKNLELQAEHLVDAQEDFELRTRQFAADLITEFQLREAGLELFSKENAYSRAKLAWSKSVLKLWDQCGYNLLELTGVILN